MCVCRAVLDVLARILFMTLLMFLAEGWTISQITLSSGSKKFIVGSVSLVTVKFLSSLFFSVWVGRLRLLMRMF